MSDFLGSRFLGVYDGYRVLREAEAAGSAQRLKSDKVPTIGRVPREYGVYLYLYQYLYLYLYLYLHLHLYLYSLSLSPELVHARGVRVDSFGGGKSLGC